MDNHLAKKLTEISNCSVEKIQDCLDMVSSSSKPLSKVFNVIENCRENELVVTRNGIGTITFFLYTKDFWSPSNVLGFVGPAGTDLAGVIHKAAAAGNKECSECSCCHTIEVNSFILSVP